MPTALPRHTPEDLARLGSDVFEHSVRPMLRAEDEGKFVAIDIQTGEYEVDDDDYSAVARLRSRNSKAEIWLAKIGQPAAYQIRRAR